jgi:hypothetical protein
MRFNLSRIQQVNLGLSSYWPAPGAVPAEAQESSAAFVLIEYSIDPADEAQFTTAIAELRLARLRGGAFVWHLLKDISDPKKFDEYFLIESWVEHLRQHERVTQEDKRVQERVDAFHRGTNPPKVSHFLVKR